MDLSTYDATLLAVVIVGALNWLVTGILNLDGSKQVDDLLHVLFFPQAVSSWVYVIVGIAGVLLAMRSQKLSSAK